MNRCKYFVLLLFFQLLIVMANGQVPVERIYKIPKSARVIPNRIVVKIREGQNTLSQPSPHRKVLEAFEIQSVLKTENVEKLSFNKKIKSGNVILSQKESILDNIYFVSLDSKENLAQSINRLLEYPNVIYAEPIFQERLLFAPNDANINSQSSLEVIKAFEAWDITHGDESIIVGISDTGVQLDHVDLASNLYFNEDDPINGIDDDGNGYVDDYQGWDFADLDNNPAADQNDHGTFVTGLSSAVTNNGVGIAGVGYNSKFVPLKVFRSDNGISSNLYESIIYAADQKYDVINLSWGSMSSFSQFNQDIINYAVLENNLVVVAAAGNTNEELQFYPASYDNVLSVANTTLDDIKAGGATYSYKVDLTAPGFGVYSTKNGSSYAFESGSSFSSPQVAGAAALVKAVFPEWNALQIMEQIRVTSDDVYDKGSNSDYKGQLGKGRLNVFRAVSEGNSHSIRIADFAHVNSFGDYAFFDDTVTVSLEFFNYLNPTVNATAILSSDNPKVNFLNPTINIGVLSEFQSSEVFESKIKLTEDVLHDERIVIRVDFLDGMYEDFQYFEFQTSPDNVNLDNSTIALNISRNGDMVYKENDRSGLENLTFKDTNVGQYFGIMIGNHPDSISDNVLNNLIDLNRERDFNALDQIKFHHHSTADWYTKSSFDDTNAGPSKLGLIIEQEAMSWNDDQNNEYIVLEYRVTNNSNKVKEDLHLGFYADWKLENGLANKSSWDISNKLAYSHDENETQFMGLALLSSQMANVHSIDIGSENGNVSEMSPTFSDEDKFNFMTVEKELAGDTGLGNDIAQLLTAKIGNLGAFENQKVAFVLAGGDNLEALKNNIGKAAMKYAEFLEFPPIIEFEEVCVDSPFTLTLEGGVQFEVFDDPQMSALLGSGNDFQFSGFAQDSILYGRNIDLDYTSDLFSIFVKVEDPKTEFSINPDTLYLGDNPINQVEFADLSKNSTSWQWSFGNGSFSTTRNPKVIYNEPGHYQIDLDLITGLGCVGSVSKELVVAERSPEPIISSQVICKGETATLTASNSSKLNVYITADDIKPIFQGEKFISGSITKDTVFYVSSIESVFESHIVQVAVNVGDLQVDFVAVADTLDFNTKKQINLYDNSEDAQAFEWRVNENLIGTESQSSFVYADQTAISVKLIVTNSMGCLDSLTKTLELISSPTPEITDLAICRFADVTLHPTNGDVFYFYDKADLAQPIYKGKEFNIGSVSANSTYYITGVDGLKEGEAKAVNIDILPFEVEIEADPEMLVLSQGKNVTLSYLSDQDVVNTGWYINGVFVESAEAPTLNLDLVGEYDIQLIGTSVEGCRDTTSINYSVIKVPITSISETTNTQIKLYPNPSEGFVHLKGTHTIENIALFHFTGQLVKNFLESSGNEVILNLSNLSDGVYVIKGSYNKKPFSKKVLVHKSDFPK